MDALPPHSPSHSPDRLQISCPRAYVQKIPKPTIIFLWGIYFGLSSLFESRHHAIADTRLPAEQGGSRAAFGQGLAKRWSIFGHDGMVNDFSQSTIGVNVFFTSRPLLLIFFQEFLLQALVLFSGVSSTQVSSCKLSSWKQLQAWSLELLTQLSTPQFSVYHQGLHIGVVTMLKWSVIT